jgi:2'-hydroxyisoflavone reductase
MTQTTRRSFLAASSAALGAAAVSRPLAAAAPFGPRRPAKKRILLLGGTSFLGPAIVDAALARGHEPTLFNRGKTNPGLFPDVEQLRGQRRRPRPDKPDDPEQDLTALQGRKWDAVVDTSGYYTGEVEDACKVLAGNVDQYVFISSLSVYESLGKTADPVTEESPLCELDDKYTRTVCSAGDASESG